MVGRDRKLLGLVTMKRLKGLIQENGSYLKDSMETDIATTGPDVVLEELFPLAAEADYPIAVIDEVGKFIGEIQISSIFENMIQEKTEGNNGRIS